MSFHFLYCSTTITTLGIIYYVIKFPFGSTYLWFTEFLSVFYYIQKPTSLFRRMRIKFYYGKSSLPNKILLTETQLTWEVFLMLFFITGLSQRSSLQCLPRTFPTQKREKETIYTGIYSFAHSYLFTIFLLYFSNFLFLIIKIPYILQRYSRTEDERRKEGEHETI